MSCIYIIKNTINDKVYIGQTVYSVEERFKKHKYDILSGRNKSKFAQAVRDLGVDKFYAEELESCNRENLNKKEIYYIKLYNSYYNGYNSNPGGLGGCYEDMDTEKFIQMYNDMIPVVEIARYFGCSVKSVHEYRRALGIKGNRDKFGNNVIKSESSSQREIYQYNKNFCLINKFESLSAVLKYLEKPKSAYYFIRNACINGNIAYGYRWQYADELKDYINDKLETFNTIFDKEAYNNGENVYRLENGLYRAKNLKYSSIKTIGRSVLKDCPICGNKIDEDGICYTCANNEINKEIEKSHNNKVLEIMRLTSEGYNLSQIGRIIGMTSNGVKKYCVKYNIDYINKMKKH